MPWAELATRNWAVRTHLATRFDLCPAQTYTRLAKVP